MDEYISRANTVANTSGAVADGDDAASDDATIADSANSAADESPPAPPSPPLPSTPDIRNLTCAVPAGDFTMQYTMVYDANASPWACIAAWRVCATRSASLREPFLRVLSAFLRVALHTCRRPSSPAC